MKTTVFQFGIPGSWRAPNYLEDDIIDKLKNLLKLKSQSKIEFHLQLNVHLRKRGDTIKLKSKEYSLSGFDSF